MGWLDGLFGGSAKRRRRKKRKNNPLVGYYTEPRKRAGRAKRHRKRHGTGILF